MSQIDIRYIDSVESIRFATGQIIDDVQSNAITIEDETLDESIRINFEDVDNLILALQKAKELRK